MSAALIIASEGSPERDALAALLRHAEQLRRRRRLRRVEVGVLSGAGTPLRQALATVAPVPFVAVLPWSVERSRLTDIILPEEVARARRQSPATTYVLAPPLGTDARFGTLLVQVARAARSDTMPWGILLVADGRGGRSDGIDALATTVWRAIGGEVVAAYLDGGESELVAGAELCVSRGVEQLAILPLFLLSGRHATANVARVSGTILRRWPSLDVQLLDPIGERPELADIAQQIALEAITRPPGRAGTVPA